MKAMVAHLSRSLSSPRADRVAERYGRRLQQRFGRYPPSGRCPSAERGASVSVRQSEWALRLWRGPVRRLVDQIAERTGLEATFVVLLAAAGFVVAAAGVGFTAVLEDVMEGDGIAGADPTVQRFFAEHRSGGLTDALRAITWLGGVAVVAH
jgi:hypothetical protein